MAERILHVSLRADGRPPSKATLIEVLNYAPDWVVYAPNCWLLWTAESVSTWYSRLRRVVAAEDQGRRRGLVPSGSMWLRWGFSVVAVALLVTVLVLRLLGARGVVF